MEWIPAPTPINENRRALAVEKTGIIGTDQVYLFDIYIEIAKDISGYDAGSFSLYDSKNQCMISEIGKPGEKELHRKADKAASICSYVILEKNPLLVFELNKHEIFKNHDAVKSGMVHSYCGFPVRNKDGYALGTFCIFHFSGVKEISPEKIELIEKLVSRLALQIDTQTEQKELTSQKISKSIDVFMDQGKLDEAEPLIRRDLAISEKALGPDHPHVAITLNNLAELLRVRGSTARLRC